MKVLFNFINQRNDYAFLLAIKDKSKYDSRLFDLIANKSNVIIETWIP